MSLKRFEVSIFSQPKAEWTNNNNNKSDDDNVVVDELVLQVHSPDSSHLRFFVTDFHSQNWESIRSLSQLEDMRDCIGIAGSWSDFIDYIVASLNSQDAKLLLQPHSTSGPASAKLLAQKSKGMPRIVIPLIKLTHSAATDAMAKFSLDLFKAFKNTQLLYIQEQQRTLDLSKQIALENELYSKRHKSEGENASDANVSATATSNGKDSPGKQAAKSPVPKVVNRVVPAFRRAKVRGALLQDADDDEDA
ncbi:hypothetical protein ACFE04_019048 [Oxalis oulophora]